MADDPLIRPEQVSVNFEGSKPDEGECSLIEPGIYEQLVTEALRGELDSLDGRFKTRSRSLHTAEAADRIALHISRRIQQTLPRQTPRPLPVGPGEYARID